jgi:hypothetical protein
MTIVDVDVLLEYLNCPAKSNFDWNSRSNEDLQQVQYISDIFFDIYKYAIECVLLNDKVSIGDLHVKLNLIWNTVKGKIGLNNKLSMKYRIKNLHEYVSNLEVLYYNLPRTVKIKDIEILYYIHVFRRRNNGQKIVSFTSTSKYYRDRVLGKTHIDLILSMIKDDIESIPEISKYDIVTFYPFNSIEDSIKYIDSNQKYLESFIDYMKSKNKLPPARPPCEFCGFKKICIWSKNI